MRRASSFVRMFVCLVVFGALALARGSHAINGQAPQGAAAITSFEVVHGFVDPPRNPHAAPTRTPDGSVWGTVQFGGFGSTGALYRIRPDGSARIIHQFTGSDGVNPSGQLLLADDGFLYGAAGAFSPVHAGTIFRIDPATETVTVVYSFPADRSVGQSPRALTAGPDGFIYGTTTSGGTFGAGTVYRFDRATSTASARAVFGGPVTGRNAFHGMTVAADGKMYGATTAGGSAGNGTLYRFDPLTGSLTTVFEFTNSPNAAQPQGALLAATDGFLYGTTTAGGLFTNGTIFRFSLGGSFAIVHAFASNAEIGSLPFGALAQALDGSIYGTAMAGGSASAGTIFRFTPQTGMTTLAYAFSNGDGATPMSVTLAADGLIYGITQGGGAAGLGSVFRFMPAASQLTTLHAFPAAAPPGFSPFSSVTQAVDGFLYGTTEGGPIGLGSVYRLDPASGSFTSLYSFTGTGTLGVRPRSAMVVAPDGALYGTTSTGGSGGAIFRLDPASETVTSEHQFTGGERASPFVGLMVASDGFMYGVTDSGGAGGAGSIYRFDPATKTRTTIHSFGLVTGAGRIPRGRLLQAGDGFLYGTTAAGGVGSGASGTLYRLDPVTGTVTTLHTFLNAGGGAASPQSGVIEASDGYLYGLTQGGGSSFRGAIYRYDRAAATLTTLHSFPSVAGSAQLPVGEPVEAADGFLYGMSSLGGADGRGAVFRFDRQSGAATTIYSFDETTGAPPQGSLVRAADGNLYGATQQLGPGGGGTIFRIRMNAPPVAEDLASVKTDEDTAVQDQLRATDPEGQSLTFTIVSNATNGTAVVTNAATGAFTYTPNANFVGDDTFTYRASDGVLDSNVATVHVGVQPVNDPPVAGDGQFETHEDEPVTGALPVSDPDGGSLVFNIVQNGTRGTAVLGPPSSPQQFTYRPAANQSGTDTFTYSVSDENLPGQSSQGTITVNITAVDDLPLARGGASTTTENVQVTGTLVGADADGDVVAFSIIGAPSHGTAVVTDATTGTFRYTPASGFAGLDSFTFSVGNSGGNTSARQLVYVVAGYPQWPGQTVLADVAGGVQGNGYVQGGDISADGRYITYWSNASNLVADDTNGQFDVFVLDRLQQVTSRASVSSTGEQGNATSYWPRISADGSAIAFYSAASNLVAGDTNARIDVFVRDRASASTVRISAAPDGTPANDHSLYPSLSADGRFVVFESSATNLVANDTNSAADVFVHDRQTGVTVRASEGAGGVQGNARSVGGSISADGRYVSFFSVATNLIAGDTNNCADILVRDMVTGTVTRVSVGSRGEEANAPSTGADISANGRYVTFESGATNLVPGAMLQGIFVHDRQTGSTTRVSENDFGGAHTLRPVFAPSISADGRYVSFYTDAPLVTEDTNNNYDVYVRDRAEGRTVRVSVASDGGQASGSIAQPRLSADGRFVIFASQAPDLVAPDVNPSQDLFVVGGAKLSARSASAPAAGASFSIGVTFAYPGTSWNTATTVPWITVGSGATGNGSVTVTIAPTTEFSGRSGVITIAAQAVRVTQQGNQDTTPPTIDITSPAATTYGLWEAVTAAFTCSDAETGIGECVGTHPSGAPIDTTSAGAKFFRVTARDKAGHVATRDVFYTVSQGTPTIAIAAGPFQFDGQPHGATASVTGVVGEVLGSATLTYNGSTSVPVEPGTYTVVASFAGNANYVPSQATATLTIERAAAAVALASTPNPSNALQLVTLIAAVTPANPAAGTPGGDVQFFDGATLLGRASVSGGTARLTTASLLSGSHTLTASYAGDTRFAPALSAGQAHTVQSIASSSITALVVSPTPSAAGAPATLVAIVTPLGGAGLPTGTVEFFDSATRLGSASVTTVGGRQMATLTTSSLGAGLHVLVARYGGSSEFGASESPWATHTVYAGTSPAATTTTITTTPNPSTAGQQFYVVVQVRSAAGTPSGNVYLTINGSVVGALPLTASGGQAVAIAPLTGGLPKGLYTFGAIYTGTAQFAASSSQYAYQCVDCSAPAALIQR